MQASEAKTTDQTVRFDRQRAKIFEDMTAHAGWKLYITLLNSHISACGEELVSSNERSVDDLVALQRVKGTMKGLIFARDLVESTIAANKDAKPASTSEEE